MNEFPFRSGDPSNGHHHGDDWSEALARTVAHLAAQLTMTQIRLRALATELTAGGGAGPAALAARVEAIAAAETGDYLRENLGEALAEIIDVETLTADVIAFLSARPEPS
jgi:hypothetical protein